MYDTEHSNISPLIYVKTIMNGRTKSIEFYTYTITNYLVCLACRPLPYRAQKSGTGRHARLVFTCLVSMKEPK